MALWLAAIRRLTCVLLGAAALFVSIDEGRAQTDDATDRAARQHFESGTEYFRTGDYEDALREFRRAHEMSGRPALLYNISAAHERLGHFAEAAEALAAFLDAGGPDDSAERPVLEARLANLRRRAAETTASQAPPTGTSEVARDPEPPVGIVAPAPQPAPEPAGPPVLAISGFAVAGAGLVAFAVLGGLALAEDDALDSRCVNPCSDAEVATLGALALGADVAAGIAAAAAVVGVVGLVVGGSAPEGSVAVRPWLAPQVVGGSVAATF